MATLAQCLNCYPFLNTLMSYLSATDSAILLAVLGLLYDADNNAYTRYVKIYKDIPDYAGWMEKMVSKGHTLLLVGKDLESLEHSYKYPLTYWKQYPRSEIRSLWLVALAAKMYKQTLTKPNIRAATDENGDVFEIPKFSEPYLRYYHFGGGCSNALCFPCSLSVSFNLPPPLPWPDCTYDMMENRSWLTLPRDEDSNIRLVYLQNSCMDDAIFDESTILSEPYYSAIFGASAPFRSPIGIPYLNVMSGEVRVSITETYTYNDSLSPLGIGWVGEEWSSESDIDSFTFAFYRLKPVPRNIAYRRQHEFMAIEFTGLDPDLCEG